jgi:hypothetical protein
VFATIMTLVVIYLPGNRSDTAFQVPYQDAVKMALGGTWRIALASLIAYWVGDFANSFVLAKMKVLTKGRFLWTRTIGSTIVGQGLDSLMRQLGFQSGRRNRVHAADLFDRQRPQAGGAGRLLRRGYELHAVQHRR